MAQVWWMSCESSSPYAFTRLVPVLISKHSGLRKYPIASLKFTKKFLPAWAISINTHDCPTSIFLCLWHGVQSNLGEERVYLAYASRSQSVIMGSQGMHPVRNLQQKPWRSAVCWLAFCLSHRLMLSYIFIYSRTTCLGLVLPTVGWLLLFQLTIKIIL